MSAHSVKFHVADGKLVPTDCLETHLWDRETNLVVLRLKSLSQDTPFGCLPHRPFGALTCISKVGCWFSEHFHHLCCRIYCCCCLSRHNKWIKGWLSCFMVSWSTFSFVAFIAINQPQFLEFWSGSFFYILRMHPLACGVTGLPVDCLLLRCDTIVNRRDFVRCFITRGFVRNPEFEFPPVAIYGVSGTELHVLYLAHSLSV